MEARFRAFYQNLLDSLAPAAAGGQAPPTEAEARVLFTQQLLRERAAEEAAAEEAAQAARAEKESIQKALLQEEEEIRALEAALTAKRRRQSAAGDRLALLDFVAAQPGRDKVLLGADSGGYLQRFLTPDERATFRSLSRPIAEAQAISHADFLRKLDATIAAATAPGETYAKWRAVRALRRLPESAWLGLLRDAEASEPGRQRLLAAINAVPYSPDSEYYRWFPITNRLLRSPVDLTGLTVEAWKNLHRTKHSDAEPWDHYGQVFEVEVVRRLLAGQLPPDFTLQTLGFCSLSKGIRELAPMFTSAQIDRLIEAGFYTEVISHLLGENRKIYSPRELRQFIFPFELIRNPNFTADHLRRLMERIRPIVVANLEGIAARDWVSERAGKRFYISNSDGQRAIDFYSSLLGLRPDLDSVLRDEIDAITAMFDT